MGKTQMTASASANVAAMALPRLPASATVMQFSLDFGRKATSRRIARLQKSTPNTAVWVVLKCGTEDNDSSGCVCPRGRDGMLPWDWLGSC